MVDVLAQLLLVAFLEGRRDLPVDLIDSLVEGAELLFGVIKVGLELFAVVLHRFEARGDGVQLTTATDLFGLLVHFRRGFAHMLDRVVDHAEAEKGTDRPLHALTFGGQGDIRLDEAQSPVAIGEKDFPQLRRQLVVDKSLRRVDGTCAAVVQRKQLHGRGGAPRLAVHVLEDRADEAVSADGFPVSRRMSGDALSARIPPWP